MLTFVRQTSGLMKIQEARDPMRAFFFKLKVSFFAGPVDSLTGFSVSLPDVDTYLKNVIQVLEIRPVKTSKGSFAEDLLNRVQLALEEAAVSGVSVQSFEVTSLESQVWNWEYPWNPRRQNQIWRVRLSGVADDALVLLSCQAIVSEDLVKNFVRVLKSQSQDLCLKRDFRDICRLAQKCNVALNSIEVQSFNDQWSLKALTQDIEFETL